MVTIQSACNAWPWPLDTQRAIDIVTLYLFTLNNSRVSLYNTIQSTSELLFPLKLRKVYKEKYVYYFKISHG